MEEFRFIDHFLGAFREAGGQTSGGEVLLGPGDDAALLSLTAPLAITTDALVEGVHFRRDWATWRQVGHKALAVNLSDLAAMGARPVAFLCALAIPRDMDETALLELARGMAPLAARHGARLCGGNVTRASELSITITALGVTKHNTLRRDRARPGDAVLLVGPLGEAGAELHHLLKGSVLPPGPSALHEPIPRCEAGLLAARHTACAIDLSDGLVQDLGHVAEASGVGLTLDFAALPRSPRFELLTQGMSEVDRARFLLAGGEDYALVVCGDASLAGMLSARVIGRVDTGHGVTVVGAPAGTSLAGWNHLREV